MPLRFVSSAGNGILYAGTSDGHLLWYRDEAHDGTPRWTDNGAAKDLGPGWEAYPAVVAAGDGVIYAIDEAGHLLYFRDLAGDGTVAWENAGVGRTIGSGW